MCWLHGSGLVGFCLLVRFVGVLQCVVALFVWGCFIMVLIQSSSCVLGAVIDLRGVALLLA